MKVTNKWHFYANSMWKCNENKYFVFICSTTPSPEFSTLLHTVLSSLPTSQLYVSTKMYLCRWATVPYRARVVSCWAVPTRLASPDRRAGRIATDMVDKRPGSDANEREDTERLPERPTDIRRRAGKQRLRPRRRWCRRPSNLRRIQSPSSVTLGRRHRHWRCVSPLTNTSRFE